MLITNNNVKIIQLDFNKDLPKLDKYWKEQIGLGIVSFYETNANEFFMVHIKKCECCYGKNPKSIFFILDKQGTVIRQETEIFYNQEIKNIKNIVKFNIPPEISKDYFYFSIK